MKRMVLLTLLLFSLFSYAQATEESMYGELFGVLYFLGILLLSFLFMLIVAIPFVEEVMKKGEIKEIRSFVSNRFVWGAETVLGLFLIYLSISVSSEHQGGGTGALIYVIAAICTLLPFGIFVTMAFISNIYKKNLLGNIFSMVLWGVVASSTALFMNQTMKAALWGLLSRPEVVILILAVFFEEALKGIGLAEFLKHGTAGPVRGMLYGFSVGVGFSMIENWLYFSHVTNPYSLGVTNWSKD
jgi:hypothetical protein